MVKKGERIYVEDLLFEGWGTVEHIIPGELFGIQLKMDEPDSDGHRIQRVGLNQILGAPSEAAEVPLLNSSEDPLVIATSKVDSANLKKGTSYLLGPNKYVLQRSLKKETANCYVYRIGDMKLLGSYPKESFADWELYNELEAAQHEEVTSIVEVSIIETSFEHQEQLSLFDNW